MAMEVFCDSAQNANSTFSLNISQHDENSDIGNSCGLFGTCVDNLCICDSGWTQSAEWDFYEADLKKRGSLCDTNVALIRGLFLLNAIVAISAIFWYIYTNRLWNDLHRSIWTFVGTICHAIYAIWRLIELDNEMHLFGVHFLSTFFNVVGTFLMYVTVWVFINKYVRHEKIRLPGEDGISEQQAHFFFKIHFMFLVIGFVAAFLMLFMALVPSKAQAPLIRVIFGLWGLTAVYSMLAFRMLIGSIIQQMKTIIKRNSNVGTSQRFNADLVAIKLKKSLPKTRAIRVVAMLGTFLQVVLVFPSLFSAAWLRTWKYLIPSYSITFIIATLAVERQLHHTQKLRYQEMRSKQEISTKQSMAVFHDTFNEV